MFGSLTEEQLVRTNEVWVMLDYLIYCGDIDLLLLVEYLRKSCLGDTCTKGKVLCA